MHNGTDNISPVKKAVAFIKGHKRLVIFGIIGVLIIIALFTPSENDTSQNAKPKLEEVDVNGLTVNEACEKIREKGWKVGGVSGLNSDYQSVETSDCSDTSHKVTSTNYYGGEAYLNFSSSKKSSKKEAKTQEAPKYEVVHQKEDVGIAHNTEYYILVNKFNLSNDKFKTKVKSIFSDIAQQEGKPEFSARIYTNKEALDYGYEPELPYPDGFSATDEEIAENQAYAKSMAKKSETTLVASYTGGIDLMKAKVSKSEKAYNILWFGSAFTDQPIVGKYVGDETWKP